MAIKPVEILIKARDEASGVFGSMGSKVAAVGAAIAAYFGIDAFVGAVKGAADLEAKLSEVKAVSGATAAEMVLLRQAAEEAGGSTKFTATEAADALGNLTRAGVGAKDAVAALPAVLQLAQAGGIDLAQASEYVSKTIMGMGLSFADAGRVADVLAKGANASNTSVTGLAQAMSYAAPLANSLGLDLETTVAIIGKFADAGIDASRAGTALNAIMAQFADPASKFRTELAGAGITTTNFEQALRQLAAAGPAGSKAILAVGTEAGPALRALLNQGIGALDDLKGKLNDAKGSAAEAAAVMEDNLSGSFNSLSSAWDTVKNALATPVLPVLKDGVEKLAAAFSGAVSDGTIGKFGDAIATAFQGGIKWVREFAAQVNFTELAARMQAFAGQAQDAFTKIGEYATNAGNIVQTVYGVMSSGVNAVMTVVYGLGEAFAGVASNIQSGLALLLDGLAKITFGGVSASFKQAADEVRLSAEATWAASEEFAQKGQQAFNAMAYGAQTARDGWAGLTADTASAATQAGTSAAVFKTVAQDLAAVGDAAETTGEKAKASGDAQKTAVDVAKKASDDLRKKAEEDAAAIAAAFERMGIKTKTELKTTADTAKVDFDSIKASGLATTDGLATAFKAYAEAAIAANGGVASETIKAQAAMYGLEIQTDRSGKSIVRAMDEGMQSTDRFTNSVRTSTQAIDGQIKAAERLRQVTSDGLKTNRDGAAAGTFGNVVPLDQANRLLDATKSGQTVNMTSAELAAAKKQATDAYEFIMAMARATPGLVSTQSINDAQALVNAANTARVNITDKATNATTPQAQAQNNTPAKTYTVNINLGGTTTAINTSSDADAQALISLLQRAKLSA
ncbi:MAG: phage tail tape measure protein [Burkholderiales bacterium RIFOXYD12_FULL_59_19]|nr:MAG: phage tail tape measure protein [Burkholderiales bacterium RIFOXYD12_FULL_59_19]